MNKRIAIMLLAVLICGPLLQGCDDKYETRDSLDQVEVSTETNGIEKEFTAVTEVVEPSTILISEPSEYDDGMVEEVDVPTTEAIMTRPTEQETTTGDEYYGENELPLV